MRMNAGRIGLVGLCILTLAVGLGCDTISRGTLREVVMRDEPPEEIAGAVSLYAGGVALALNGRCAETDLSKPGFLCDRAGVLLLSETGTLRWFYSRTGTARVLALVEASPGVLVLGGVEKSGTAEPNGFVEAIENGQRRWYQPLPADSAILALAAGLDGVWAAGRLETFGTVRLFDTERGDPRGDWTLEDPGADPASRILESAVTALIAAPERGVFAAGTTLRNGGARDTWVARMLAPNTPAQSDVFERHLGSPGFHDEPGAFAQVSAGLVLAVRDTNPDKDQVTFYLFDPAALSAGDQNRFPMDARKYRFLRGSPDEAGGAIVAGAWRTNAQGAFEPRAIRIGPDGAPDPTWKTAGDWGLRVRSEEGIASVVLSGVSKTPMVGGWFKEQGQTVGFVAGVE